VDDTKLQALNWSPWIDFDSDNISNVAESEGVFKMHASMKILFMGSSQNLKESLLECLSNPCISKAKRFSYAVTRSSNEIKEHLLHEYRSNHDGRLPSCME
jgi:hypothetical protein